MSFIRSSVRIIGSWVSAGDLTAGARLAGERGGRGHDSSPVLRTRAGQKGVPELTHRAKQTPPACTLSPGDQVSRRQQWLRLADEAFIAKEATRAGVELHYRAEPAVLAELTELAGLEAEYSGVAEWKVHGWGQDPPQRGN